MMKIPFPSCHSQPKSDMMAAIVPSTLMTNGVFRSANASRTRQYLSTYVPATPSRSAIENSFADLRSSSS